MKKLLCRRTEQRLYRAWLLARRSEKKRARLCIASVSSSTRRRKERAARARAKATPYLAGAFMPHKEKSSRVKTGLCEAVYILRARMYKKVKSSPYILAHSSERRELRCNAGRICRKSVEYRRTASTGICMDARSRCDAGASINHKRAESETWPHRIYIVLASALPPDQRARLSVLYHEGNSFPAAIYMYIFRT